MAFDLNVETFAGQRREEGQSKRFFSIQVLDEHFASLSRLEVFTLTTGTCSPSVIYLPWRSSHSLSLLYCVHLFLSQLCVCVCVCVLTVHCSEVHAVLAHVPTVCMHAPLLYLTSMFIVDCPA